MIKIMESAAAYKKSKPVICPKCKIGTLGYMPEKSERVIARRGKPPPDGDDGGVQIKCPACRQLWILTTE
jgi:phage FluMu protein Com